MIVKACCPLVVIFLVLKICKRIRISKTYFVTHLNRWWEKILLLFFTSYEQIHTISTLTTHTIGGWNFLVNSSGKYKEQMLYLVAKDLSYLGWARYNQNRCMFFDQLIHQSCHRMSYRTVKTAKLNEKKPLILLLISNYFSTS